MARAMGLDRMEISLPQGFDVGNTAPERGVIRGIASGSDTGNEPVGRGNEVDKHPTLLSICPQATPGV